MSNGAPTFAELSTGPTSVLREYLITVVTVLVVAWLLLPVEFEPPPTSIPFLLLSPPDLTCEAWNPQIRRVERCVQLSSDDPDPLKDPRRYISPGGGIGVLDPSLWKCDSTETRSGADRYFLIRCPPARNHLRSWQHELAHLYGGHSSMQYKFIGFIFRLPEWPRAVCTYIMNMFLDTFYVTPALLIGQQGSNWFRYFVAALWFGLLLLRVQATWRTKKRSSA